MPTPLNQRLRIMERAVAALSSGVLITDPAQPENPIILCNPAFERITGYSADEVLGRNCRFLQGSGTDPAAVRTLREAVRAGHDCKVVLKNYRKDGTPFWNELVITPVRDDAGLVTHFVGIQSDITAAREVEETARREMAQTLSQQAALLRLASHDKTNFDTDLRGILRTAALTLGVARVSFWNFQDARTTIAVEQLYLADGDRIERNIKLRRDDFPRYFAALAREPLIAADDAQNDPLTSEFTASYLAPLGITSMLDLPVWLRGECVGLLCHEHIGPMRRWTLEEQKFAASIGDMISLSLLERERCRADELLREQASLLDLTHDAIFVRDLTGRILHWNRGAERLHGIPAAEALGQSHLEICGGDSPASDEAEAALLARGAWSGELPQTARDGRRLVVDARWTLVRDERGTAKSILAIHTDITARKELEQRFLRTQRMEAIGTLASGISHDLNNILSPILMSASLLRGEVNPDAEELIDTIENAARRGTSVVRQVLTFARGVEGERGPVQPRHLLAEMEKIAHDTFPKSIDVRLAPAGPLPTVAGDATQLHQVLLNLCVNARDAMPDGGTLTLGGELFFVDESYAAMLPGLFPGPHVVLRVADTGPGISPHVAEKMFDPFFTTKPIGEGTGLGLSTVLGIMKSHGGAVRLRHEPGSGAVFEIFLPASACLDPAPAASAPAPLPRGRGQTLLVVDDEPVIRDVARSILTRHGYVALLAADGTEALALYARHGGEIAAVITDIVMPFFDGVALARALRKLNPDVKIITWSGLAIGSRAAELQELGVTAQLTKPFNARDLLETLQIVLDPAR